MLDKERAESKQHVEAIESGRSVADNLEENLLQSLQPAGARRQSIKK